MNQHAVTGSPLTCQNVLDAPDDARRRQARPAVRHAYTGSARGEEIGGPYHLGRGGPGGFGSRLIDRTLEAIVLRDARWTPAVAREDDGEVRVPRLDFVAVSLGVHWPD